MSALTDHAEDVAAHLAIWAGRDGNEGTPEQRQAANDAMDAIDALDRLLSAARSHLVGEMRAFDDETGRRVDAMLAKYRAGVR